MITLKAPAKINLTLEILGRRDDGYHTLRSLMVPIGLYDEIRLERASHPSFESDPPGLESDNLVTRALASAGVTAAYAVKLHKHIPVGGGLGGGSSDAAAILHAAMEGKLEGEPVDWLRAARSLGSDVPFFLTGTGALVEGTGERLTAVGRLPLWWALVVQPLAAVETAAAYRMLDEAREHETAGSRARSQSVSLDAVDALQRADLPAMLRVMSNDFHDLVLDRVPAVKRAYDAIVGAGAARALLSGSGSCLFALFDDRDGAETVRDRLDSAAISQAFVAPLVTGDAWR
jgi:4-diphosphocytidyl-2-C-methyl-D-erythritol kinase